MELLPEFCQTKVDSASFSESHRLEQRHQINIQPEHGLVDREGDTDVDNARAPSGHISDEDEEEFLYQESERLTRATLLEQEQQQLEAAVWGSCTIQDGGTGSVPS